MSEKMTMRVRCPHCNGTCKAPLSAIGRVGRCKKCGEKFRISQDNLVAQFSGDAVQKEQLRVSVKEASSAGDAERLKAKAERKMDEAAEQRLATKDMKVLLVDDEPDLHTVLKALLDSKGLHTLSAYNGKQGVKMAHKESPACIVMDGEMPKMNGFQACSKLKTDTRYAHIPIIMLTGLPKKSGRSETYWREKSLADSFVTKPFDYHALTQLIVRTILESQNEDKSQRYTIDASRT